MSELRVKISGFGGQGIILSAFILGKAASIYDQQYSSMTQAYGPEARGGACSSQVVISPKSVEYPLVDTADVLLAMSQEGYDTFLPILKKGGILCYDTDLVEKMQSHKDIIAKGIPATRLAEELGKKIVANIVMLGFATKQAKIATPEAMKGAITDSVPKKFTDLNMKAFQAGYDYDEDKS
ncbi:MAG: 2-oxoacid:acceptor oxidoreductase family protein [Candidatus Cloacimonetes bacterium]|nr:2-oxoacid:acceptor oxidoreductase family protein [Candidatus Cloacimonadota bacterium]